MALNVWKMRDGTPIRVSDMETSHVINTRNMMQRNLAKWQDWELDHPDHWRKLGKMVDRCLAWINRFNEELAQRGQNNS